MSLRTLSIMVLGPLILTVGAVLFLTPKDILRQPLVTGAVPLQVAGTPAPQSVPDRGPGYTPAQPAPVILLSDLAPSLEPPVPDEQVAPMPEAVPAPPPADRRWIAASGGLNLRGGPGVDSPLIASLPFGARVDVLETSGSWARVVTAEFSGWLSLNFLTSERPGGVN